MFYLLKTKTARKKFTGTSSEGSFFVELLIYMTVLMILVPPAIGMMSQSLNSFFSKRDIAIIDYRYRTAVAMISRPVFYSGTGLPSSPEDFKTVFKNSQKTPFLWGSPVSVSDNGHELRLLYAKPQGKTVMSFSKNYSSREQILTLSTPVDSNRIITKPDGSPNNIKNIMLVPSMFPSRMPFIVRGLYRGSYNRYIVEAALESDYLNVPRGAEVYLLYACRAFCDRVNSVFRTQDYRMSGSQPRVRGIEDVCFKFDQEHKILEIYFLVRGNFKYSDIQPVLDSDLWPSDIKSHELEYSSNHKRRVYKCVLGVPNFE